MMRHLASLLCLLVLPGFLFAQEGKAGALEGRVVWRGEIFPPREVLWPPGSRGHDVVLEGLLIDRTILDESLVIDPETRGLRDVLLVLPGYKIRGAPPALREIVLENLAIKPRLIVLDARTGLRAINRDPIPHVLGFVGDDDRVRTVEIAPGARVDLDLPHRDRLELVSERFEFMRARVRRIADRPTIVTAADGRFAIQGLRAERIQLDFEHPVLGRGSRTVQIAAGAATEIEIDESDFERSRDAEIGSPFSTAVDPLFRIEGIAVPRADVEAVVAFLAARHHRFSLPRKILESHALRQVLVPVAAGYAHHRDELPRLRALGARLESGFRTEGSVGEAVRTMKAASEYRSFGPVGRDGIDPWIGLAVFAAAKRSLIGPIWSVRGLHYLVVRGVEGEGLEERRSGEQVFFPWRGDLDEAGQRKLGRALAERARVEVIAPERPVGAPVDR